MDVPLVPEILKAQERLATIKQEMHSMMRELFMTVPDQLVKADPAHVFVIHEFDSYGDYELFYIRFKEDLTNLLRLMTSIDASLTAQCMLQFLDHVNSATAAPLSKWESAVLVLDCVCNKLPQTQEVNRNKYSLLLTFCFLQYADMVLPLMMHLLTVPTQQPDLISIQLSCVSALSAFLPLFSSSITKQLVDRVSGSVENRMTN